jgi:glycerol-3-phosphate acyltransferase PlsY
LNLLFWLLVCYLLGSIPTSLIASRFIARVELRHHGSGNLGATNIYRVLGWKYAFPTFLIDAAKGAFAVLVLAPQLGPDRWNALLMGAIAMFGHVFSVFASFKGGKGVATAAGVVLALAPLAAAVSLAVWAVLVWLTGYVSVGSIVGSSLFPLVAWIAHPSDRYAIVSGIALASFIVFNHRGNIERLRAGTEARFRSSKTEPN